MQFSQHGKRKTEQPASGEFDSPVDPVTSALKEFAKSETLKYQQIPGLEQEEASDRSYLNQTIFGEPIAGKSVLDIGSNLGYFCIEALRRGASEAVGIDPDPENIRKAQRIAKLSNLQPVYIEGDFENYDWHRRSFDIVLCLNVLHHMFDPVHAIRRMIELARDRVVIEFAAPQLRDVLKGKLSFAGLLGSFGPSIILGDSKYYSDGSRTFLFTRRAMQILFNKHHAIFEPVRIVRSPFKGRLLLEAKRRRIGHLVVIAGPTAAGKSTLIDKLLASPELRSRFQMSDGAWEVCNAGPRKLPPLPIERAIFHYDLLRPFGRSLRSMKRDISLQILQAAERVSIFTLVTEAETMRRRLQSEMSQRHYQNTRHRTVREAYGTADFLEHWYGQWIHFCNGLSPKPQQHKLVTAASNGDYVIHDLTAFGSLLAKRC